jgi:hypothetical protein
MKLWCPECMKEYTQDDEINVCLDWDINGLNFIINILVRCPKGHEMKYGQACVNINDFSNL